MTRLWTGKGDDGTSGLSSGAASRRPRPASPPSRGRRGPVVLARAAEAVRRGARRGPRPDADHDRSGPVGAQRRAGHRRREPGEARGGSRSSHRRWSASWRRWSPTSPGVRPAQEFVVPARTGPRRCSTWRARSCGGRAGGRRGGGQGRSAIPYLNRSPPSVDPGPMVEALDCVRRRLTDRSGPHTGGTVPSPSSFRLRIRRRRGQRRRHVRGGEVPEGSTPRTWPPRIEAKRATSGRCPVRWPALLVVGLGPRGPSTLLRCGRWPGAWPVRRGATNPVPRPAGRPRGKRRCRSGTEAIVEGLELGGYELHRLQVRTRSRRPWPASSSWDRPPRRSRMPSPGPRSSQARFDGAGLANEPGGGSPRSPASGRSWRARPPASRSRCGTSKRDRGREARRACSA